MIIDRGNFLQNNFVPVYNRPNNAMLTYHGTSLDVTKAWQKYVSFREKIGLVGGRFGQEGGKRELVHFSFIMFWPQNVSF